MNEPQALENQTATEVASLMIPIAGGLLLLPTVTVAEMVPFKYPERSDDMPDWYLGNFSWRDQMIPLVSFEGLNGEAVPDYSGTCRIAVLNNTGVDERLPFLGLATQGIPRLSRVKSDEIHQTEDAELKAFDLMSVYHAGESVIIPNTTAIEEAIIKLAG
ncbi:chemotaxis protein CheW [Aurantivibrio infirmus]